MTKTGELLSRLSEDTQVIKNAATVNLSETLRSLTTSLVGVGFMFQTSWQLTCNKCLPSLKSMPISIFTTLEDIGESSLPLLTMHACYMHTQKFVFVFLM